jgi:DNA-binding GntR family transcriptional regulator
MERKQSQRQRAYETLRQAIVSGELAPGTPLAELQLAAQLSLSRTPVREALVNLSQQGLVELVPGRGATVARVLLEDAAEIYLIREALEGMAARMGGARVPQAEIERLERLFDGIEAGIATGNPDPSFETTVGQQLHLAIVEAAHSRRLTAILEQMQGQTALALSMAALVPGRIRQSVIEHREILAALRARDATAAEVAMRRHLASTRADLLHVALEGSVGPALTMDKEPQQ